MLHRLHLLVEYADDKNITYALAVKNSMSLMVMAANACCNGGVFVVH